MFIWFFLVEMADDYKMLGHYKCLRFGCDHGDGVSEPCDVHKYKSLVHPTRLANAISVICVSNIYEYEALFHVRFGYFSLHIADD